MGIPEPSYIYRVSPLAFTVWKTEPVIGLLNYKTFVDKSAAEDRLSERESIEKIIWVLNSPCQCHPPLP